MTVTNSGYEITQELYVGKTIFVIGHNEKAVEPYVTWLYVPETEGYTWGHYFSDELSAQKDLIKRASDELARIEARSAYREAVR